MESWRKTLFEKMGAIALMVSVEYPVSVKMLDLSMVFMHKIFFIDLETY